MSFGKNFWSKLRNSHVVLDLLLKLANTHFYFDKHVCPSMLPCVCLTLCFRVALVFFSSEIFSFFPQKNLEKQTLSYKLHRIFSHWFSGQMLLCRQNDLKRSLCVGINHKILAPLSELGNEQRSAYNHIIS